MNYDPTRICPDCGGKQIRMEFSSKCGYEVSIEVCEETLKHACKVQVKREPGPEEKMRIEAWKRREYFKNQGWSDDEIAMVERIEGR